MSFCAFCVDRWPVGGDEMLVRLDDRSSCWYGGEGGSGSGFESDTRNGLPRGCGLMVFLEEVLGRDTSGDMALTGGIGGSGLAAYFCAVLRYSSGVTERVVLGAMPISMPGSDGAKYDMSSTAVAGNSRSSSG